jgi:NAD(P)-dependent dehydrogenase (short-subunit alcohol dehydrogenase family)
MSGILIITGGGRGIGAETSLKAAEAGWDICVSYQSNEARAREIADKVEATGRRALIVQADIAREADVVRLFETCDAELGVPTGLVNSAGILEPLSRIDEIDGDGLTEHVMINVVGNILCAREAVKRMSTKNGGNGGVIVNLSSRTSELGGAGASVHYGASKAAINTFTLGLAQEVAAEGVRVCAVSPGVIDTEIQPEGRVEAISPTLPMKRVGQPGEVANAIVWLLSDDASYVSGTVLNVSGAR